MGPSNHGVGEGLVVGCLELGVRDAHEFPGVLAIMSCMDIFEEDALVFVEGLTVDWDSG